MDFLPPPVRRARSTFLARTVRVLVRSLASAAFVAALIAGSLRTSYLNAESIALLILAGVVALAVYTGVVEALVAAAVGGIGLDYFYLPPLGFGIEKLDQWITLVVFFLAAIFTGNLASRLKLLLDKRNSLMQLSLEPLCITDLSGNLESVNEALANLLRWPGQELKTRPFVAFVHSADQPRTQAAIRKVVETDSTIEIENRCQSKEGDWRWLHWRISMGDGPWLSAAARDITEEKLAQEKLRALADQVMNAQEEERRRIARELHDDFTQRLAALGIELGLLKHRGDGSVDATLIEDLTRLQGGVVSLSEDIRLLSHSLHPSVLEHSTLAAALEMYCREFSQQSGIAVSFVTRDVPVEIPQPMAVAFYRIAQEALRNVALHSGATSASTILSGEKLALTVIDNGRGFDVAKAKISLGLGLVSMEERARLAGAVVTITSIPGEGTAINVEVTSTGKIVL